MTFSTEEVLIIIGLMITVIGSLFVAFAFCMNKVVTLAKDLSSLNEKYDSLEASKFSQDERMNKLEQKQTAMDKEMSLSSYKLDTVLIRYYGEKAR